MEAPANQDNNKMGHRNESRLTSSWNVSERATGTRNMIFGLIWIIAGLSFVLYLTSQVSNGNNILLPLLAVIFGAVQFFKGLMEYYADEDLEEEDEENK